MNTSLWMMSLLLLVDGATFAFFTTPILLTFGKFHAPWAVALVGGASNAAGSAVQLMLLRWLLSSGHPWMKRWTPSREKVEASLKQYPAASFMALMVARATPLPDLPLKVVAAVMEYPVHLYTLAVFLGALPYFYLLAQLAHSFRPPTWVILAAIALIVAGVAIDRLRARQRTKS